MAALTGSEWLFYSGTVVMAAAGISAVAAVVLFRVSGKRLKARLEAEYGKKRH